VKSSVKRGPKQHKRSRPATIGLIVEGETEFYALPLLYRKELIPGCPPLKLINLGGVGSHLNATGVAKLIAPKVKQHLAAGLQHVVICLDREQRDDCPGGFAGGISRELLAALGTTGRGMRIHVVIADRTFEAWLLADAAGLHQRGLLKTAPKFRTFEGALGEQGRKGTIELTRLLGREYRKTLDGPKLFEQLDFTIARAAGRGQRGSRSLDKLLRTLGV
jgi:hypothetical protein